jgi:hypothetical protein
MLACPLVFLNFHVVVTGVPADNDYTFCMSNVTAGTCYFYVNQAADYLTARTRCRARGGQLIAYNTDQEQLDVGGWAWRCVAVHVFSAQQQGAVHPNASCPCCWLLLAAAGCCKLHGTQCARYSQCWGIT